MAHVNPTPPTQNAHPWRAALRTGGATLISLLAFLAVAGPEIVKFIEEQWPGSPAAAWAASAVAVIVSLSILVNRIALLPAFANLLARLGLGPAPKQ